FFVSRFSARLGSALSVAAARVGGGPAQRRARARAGPWPNTQKTRHSRQARHHLLEKFQPLPAYAVLNSHETGDIATRTRQAVDETGTDRIDDRREYDRHRAGRLQQRPHRRAALSQNDFRRERDQFRRVSADVVSFASGPASVDPNVAADDPARF